MSKRRAWFFAVVPLGYLAFVACVGDEPLAGADPDAGGTPAGDSSTATGDAGPSDDGGAPTDGGGDASDAAPPCGYPGEACCAAPATACRVGATCSTGTPGRCVINEVVAVGEYSATTNGGFPLVKRMVTATWDGAVWTEGSKLDIDISAHVDAVFAAAPGQYRVLVNRSGEGKYYFLEGANWKDCSGAGTCAGPTGTLGNLYAVTHVNNNWWIGGVNAIYRCVLPARCALLTTGLGAQNWGQGNFTGPSEQDLWYSSQTKALHFDGTSWTVHDGVKARSIHQVRKDDVWVGDQTFQHWDGTEWSGEMSVDGNPAPFLVMSIGGAEPNDLIAVGNLSGASSSARWNGEEWKLVSMPAAALDIQHVYAPSTSEAFTGGRDNKLFKWNGTTWTEMTSPTITPGPNETDAVISWRVFSGPARIRP